MKTKKREFQIGSVAHATIFIGYVFLFAFIFPLLIWLREKKSKFIKFQAKQATIYQIIVLLVILIASPITALFISQYQQPKAQECAVENLATCTLSQPIDLRVLTKSLRLVIYTVFSLYALYGTYQVSKGRDFRYFSIGSLIK